MHAAKNKVGTQDWFYHAPSSTRPANGDVAPIISQIPGLSHPSLDKSSNENNHYKRKWIRDTDSKYIKLAKAGGRKDLFRYRDHKRPEEPVPYPRVDWFDHEENDSLPEDNQMTDMKKTLGDNNSNEHSHWMEHEEYSSPPDHNIESTEKGRPLLGYDSLSTWKRDDLKFPQIASQKSHQKSRKSKSVQAPKKETKFPPIKRQNSIDNGDMAGLLSFQYQKEFLDDTIAKERDRMQKITKEKKLAKEKMQNGREMFQKKKKKLEIEPSKPLFKMSKFDNVPSRVMSHR